MSRAPKKKSAHFDVRETISKPGGYADEVVLGRELGRVLLESLDSNDVLDVLRNEGMLNDLRGDDVEAHILDNHVEVTINQRPALYLYFRPTKKIPSMADLA